MRNNNRHSRLAGPDGQLNGPPVAPITIEHTAYPHIIDRIFKLSSRQVLFAFRRVSKHYCRIADSVIDPVFAADGNSGKHGLKTAAFLRLEAVEDSSDDLNSTPDPQRDAWSLPNACDTATCYKEYKNAVERVAKTDVATLLFSGVGHPEESEDIDVRPGCKLITYCRYQHWVPHMKPPDSDSDSETVSPHALPPLVRLPPYSFSTTPKFVPLRSMRAHLLLPLARPNISLGSSWLCYPCPAMFFATMGGFEEVGFTFVLDARQDWSRTGDLWSPSSWLFPFLMPLSVRRVRVFWEIINAPAYRDGLPVVPFHVFELVAYYIFRGTRSDIAWSVFGLDTFLPINGTPCTPHMFKTLVFAYYNNPNNPEDEWLPALRGERVIFPTANSLKIAAAKATTFLGLNMTCGD